MPSGEAMRVLISMGPLFIVFIAPISSFIALKLFSTALRRNIKNFGKTWIILTYLLMVIQSLGFFLMTFEKLK